MKRFIPLLVSLCILATFVGGSSISQAQESKPPVVDILGQADASASPPNAQADISVVDPATGRIIDGLSDDNFSVQVSGEEVEAKTSLETTGVAMVIVIDRGGIAQRGDKRIGQAVDLTDSLLGMLNVDSTASSDMVGLIGIRGQEEGGLTPRVQLTDFDPNAVSNEFNGLRTEVVNEVTPLYDGIDQAIEWLTENPNSEIQDKLKHRRPMIVLFSDGIDNRFSNEAHETIIINKCLENDILLYAVRMGGGPTDEDNLQALVTQTNGVLITHTPDTQEETLNLFEDIVTQRQSYHITFPLLEPKGSYPMSIRVLDTPNGDGADETTVSSPLQSPKISLTSPSDGTAYTVPYSQTLESFEEATIPLKVQVTPSDEVSRDPPEVSYFYNGVLIGSSADAPEFAFSWDVSTIVTPTEEMQKQRYTLMAIAKDPYLDEQVESDPVTIQVTWEAKEYTIQDKGFIWLGKYWWLLVILAAMALVLLILLILLIRTRSEVARKVVTRTTGVLKGFTKKLGAAQQNAPGKLVVTQGANAGREFRLAAQVVKIGRDPQFCDFALYDEYTSNPHFSVQMEQTRFFITDEGSTNGTQVNGAPLQAHQRISLPPDSIIEVGQTQLQFKRLGGKTRQLDAQRPGVSPAGAPAPHPPTKQASSPKSPPEDQPGQPNQQNKWPQR